MNDPYWLISEAGYTCSVMKILFHFQSYFLFILNLRLLSTKQKDIVVYYYSVTILHDFRRYSCCIRTVRYNTWSSYSRNVWL